MNRRHTAHIIVLILTLAGVVPLWAQNTNTQDDAIYTSRDNANFDSLLNSYYWKKYSSSVNRHYERKASQTYAEFDQIPDSVLERRLKRLPMVIPMTYNSEVRSIIRSYVRIMERRCDVWLTLSEYYFPMFEEILDRYKVPQELKYLTIVESALNPQATSRAGAAGLWQFMYRTGKNYDLEVNSLVDDRRDPMASTEAAARYLRDLNNIYHDWHLSLAAYNCGPGNVNKAIARAGGNRGFWEIYPYLPRETRGYIPRFIAACYIMNYYHEHGIRPKHINVPIHSDTIHLNKDALYYFIQQYTGIDVEELRTLNPQYRADLVPAQRGHNVLYLPVSKIPTFIKWEDSIYCATHDSVNKKPTIVVQETEKIIHVVKRGETITKVAARYGVTVNQIKNWNKKRNTTIQAGERLTIYRKNPNYVAPNSDNTVADSTAVTTEQLETPRTKPEPKPAASAPVKYKVKHGDTLSSIARKHNTTVDKLMKLNGLKNANIREGQTLIIKK